jgi:DNA-binding response OmpR family regulator
MKFLYVDDQSLNLKMMSMILSFNGQECIIESDSTKVLSRDDLSSFDAILLDLHMPEIDGFTLAHELQHKINVPMIAVSALDKRDNYQKVLSVGMCDYIEKPITQESIKKLIEFVKERKQTTVTNMTM